MKPEDDDLSWPEDLDAFARSWMAELRTGSEPRLGDFGDKVVTMNFLAPPETQWRFLLAAVAAAEAEDELIAIAAGPFEHLLGFHGEAYIEAVEARSQADPKFAHMTLGSWRHRMSDEVWARVQAIQASAAGKRSVPSS